MAKREIFGLYRDQNWHQSPDSNLHSVDVAPPPIEELPAWLEARLAECDDDRSREDIETALITARMVIDLIAEGNAREAADLAVSIGQYLARWEIRPARNAQASRRAGKGDLTVEQWRAVVARRDELAPQYRLAEAARRVRTEIMQGAFGEIPPACIPDADTIRRKKLPS